MCACIRRRKRSYLLLFLLVCKRGQHNELEGTFARIYCATSPNARDSLRQQVFIVLSAVGLTTQVVERCCELGRLWVSQSHDACGPYPHDVTDHRQTGVENVGDEVACIAAIDACCVLERRAAQCHLGRQTALAQSACHGLHDYQGNDDAKVIDTPLLLTLLGTLLW